MRLPRYPFSMNVMWLRMVMAALGVLCLTTEVGAVVTVTAPYSGPRTVQMQVGTATSGVIDVVRFNVANTPVGDFQTMAASINGNGTPLLASSGGVVITIAIGKPLPTFPNESFTTTVTSPVFLTCDSGSGCGSATIPFSAISWTSTTVAGASLSAYDIQNGTFAGGSTQSLSTFPNAQAISGDRIVRWSNTMTFSYANAIAYPAGSYTGRVTYTATLL